MADLVLRDGRVGTHTDVIKAEVAIEGEKIAANGKGLRKSGKEVNAKGTYVIPRGLQGRKDCGQDRAWPIC